MKISELIGAVEALKAQHGDVLAGIHDADTSWTLNIQAVEFDARLGCVVVRGDYGDEIELPDQPTDERA